MTVTFKINSGRIVDYEHDEVYYDHQDEYPYEVPVETIHKAIVEIVAEDYGFNKDMFKKFLENHDNWYDDLEQEYEDSIKEYVLDNCEADAMNELAEMY